MATQKQVNDFINKVAPIAQAKASGREKWSLPSVCIAQCCCESAYGTSPKMMRANNLYNPVRGTIATLVIQFIFVADHGDIRLRIIPVIFIQENGKWGRIYFTVSIFRSL